MNKGPRLVASQWKVISSALSNIGQGIVLFSLVALFVPETVGLNINFSRRIALSF
jgi:hypothetical protein